MRKERTMTKRICALLLVIAALGVAVPASAAPSTSDVKGNQCLDIADGKGLSDDGNLAVRLILSKPSCSSALYTLAIYDDETSTEPLMVLQQRGDGAVDPVDGPVVDFLAFVADDTTDGYSCVVATTSRNSGRVIDRGPDEGCFEVYDPDTGGSPARGMR
jgi:hypothetical protein